MSLADRGAVPRSLAAILWGDNQDLATAALAHPFIRGLADGSLPTEVFRRYVAQDAFFLDCFARGYALALAHSPDRETLDAFADLLAGVRDELRLHAAYAREWGVEDMSTVEPMGATWAYTDFLIATASRGDTGLTCAAMTPCMRLYAHLGQSVAAAGILPDNPYAQWVTTYADPAFESLAGRLEHLLDAHATDTPDVRRAYRRAMRLELAFFDAPAHDGPGSG